MDKPKQIHTAQFPSLTYRKMGQGPVLMLVHGFPESNELWREVCDSLSMKYTLLIPDLPGAGGSTFKGEGVSVEGMAESMNEILIAEDIERAVIAGHSMGGYTALAFAEKYPGKLKGLSLVHSFAGADTEEKKETRRKSIALMEKDKGKETFIRQMIPNLFSEAFKEKHPEVLELETENALRLETKAMVSFYNAMINRPDRAKVLQDAAFPVQIVIGKEDKAIPIDVAAQQSTLSRRTFVEIYTDCAHMGMLEQPQQLTRDLEEFTEFCYRR
ncbi:MAG: alpha/beta hydrolase [Sphingobacteriales bacterium]|nr:MAG: alpha/beta hydrolase [Sphingobacteriales bacterium]